MGQTIISALVQPFIVVFIVVIGRERTDVSDKPTINKTKKSADKYDE